MRKGLSKRDIGLKQKVNVRVFVVALACISIGVGCNNNLKEESKNDDSIRLKEENTEKTENLNVTTDIETVYIEGLEEEYQFLYMADTHVIIKTREELGDYGNAEQRINMFSSKDGKTSAEQFPEWIQIANEKQVDALLMGGDIVDYLSEENFAYIDEYLEQLECPYIYTMGNHDAFIPWESRNDYENEILLKHFIDADYGCQILDFGEFIICSIDDSAGTISSKTLEEFKGVYAIGKPIILIMHIPINTNNTLDLEEKTREVRGEVRLIGTNSIYVPDATTEEFLNFVLSEEGLVKEVLAGHVHFYYKSELNQWTEEIISDGAYEGRGLLINVKGSNRNE